MNKTNVILFTFIKSKSLDSILNQVLAYSPQILYIVSDLTRNNTDLEYQKEVVRIVNSFNDRLNIVLLSPNEHLGISKIVDFGLDTIFEKEEQIIILEDDNVPSHSFFDFCNLTLNLFKEDSNIGSVIGSNLINNTIHTCCFKSRFGLPYWGWATWKNKWCKLPKSDTFFESKFSGNPALDDILYTLYNTKGGNVSWDVRWSIYQYLNNLAVILPDINLVSNEGFSPLGTFTKNENSAFKLLPTFSVEYITDWCLGLESGKVFEIEYIQKIHSFLNELKNN